jgi:hypothetical protein
MSKRYFCDICGEEDWTLYDWADTEGRVFALCHNCFAYLVTLRPIEARGLAN